MVGVWDTRNPMVKFVRNMGMGMGMGGRKLRKKVLRFLLFLCFGWVLNGGFWSSFFSITRTTISLGPLSHLFPSVFPLRRKKPLTDTTWGSCGEAARRSVRGRKTLQSQRCWHFNHQLHHRCGGGMVGWDGMRGGCLDEVVGSEVDEGYLGICIYICTLYIYDGSYIWLNYIWPKPT